MLKEPGPLGFIEIHAENYMGAGGRPHAMLERLCRDYPLSIHGVGLSIGGAEPLNKDHLSRLKTLCDRYQPSLFSEHLAWSSHSDVFFNDLLPLPYTAETLKNVSDHVDQLQEILGRQVLIENPSTYMLFDENTFSETEFLKEIVSRTGCRLLLDINNVFVSSTNHQIDPHCYLADFPLHAVSEIHLGGHHVDADDHSAVLLIDSHSSPVIDDVWRLYEHTINRIGPVSTLIEWDNDVPEWTILHGEIERALSVLLRGSGQRAA
jgi:uncharacterized protein (UPF0276 family)